MRPSNRSGGSMRWSSTEMIVWCLGRGDGSGSSPAISAQPVQLDRVLPRDAALLFVGQWRDGLGALIGGPGALGVRVRLLRRPDAAAAPAQRRAGGGGAGGLGGVG